jgi:hypothetical protein
VKYKLQVVEKSSHPNFASAELDILLNTYEDSPQKKIENNRLKRGFNEDITLEETAELMEYKRTIDSLTTKRRNSTFLCLMLLMLLLPTWLPLISRRDL